MTRAFRDGHTETWYAADARLGWWGPDGARRLVAATADPAALPDKATWYLVTNLARPGGPREEDSPWPAASLAEIVRIYGLRDWAEQSYKQVKDELGWADFQVRSDIAIRRHQALVNCAFPFCWPRPVPLPTALIRRTTVKSLESVTSCTTSGPPRGCCGAPESCRSRLPPSCCTAERSRMRG